MAVLRTLSSATRPCAPVLAPDALVHPVPSVVSHLDSNGHETDMQAESRCTASSMHT